MKKNAKRLLSCLLSLLAVLLVLSACDGTSDGGTGGGAVPTETAERLLTLDTVSPQATEYGGITASYLVERDAVKALEEDAYKFYERAKAHEILVVPCDDFGVKGYVRIAYCTAKSTVIGALPAFEALAKEYNK